jgi:hypothetical protein
VKNEVLFYGDIRSRDVACNVSTNVLNALSIPASIPTTLVLPAPLSLWRGAGGEVIEKGPGVRL